MSKKGNQNTATIKLNRYAVFFLDQQALVDTSDGSEDSIREVLRPLVKPAALGGGGMKLNRLAMDLIASDAKQAGEQPFYNHVVDFYGRYPEEVFTLFSNRELVTWIERLGFNDKYKGAFQNKLVKIAPWVERDFRIDKHSIRSFDAGDIVLRLPVDIGGNLTGSSAPLLIASRSGLYETQNVNINSHEYRYLINQITTPGNE